MSWAGVGCSPGEGNGAPDLECPQQHLGAYFVIPPNPARRNEIQRIASKELEDLAKWKEQHKPGPITLKPQKLGGRATEAEVREKQQFEYIQSKYQQKLKKEDYERNKREAEEADILKKKAIQRGKANKLEEQRRQQEWQRQKMLREDHSAKTTEFLRRLDLGPPHRMSCQTGYCSPEFTPQARSYICKQTQRQEKNRTFPEMKEEQRRKLVFKMEKEEAASLSNSEQEEQSKRCLDILSKIKEYIRL